MLYFLTLDKIDSYGNHDPITHDIQLNVDDFGGDNLTDTNEEKLLETLAHEMLHGHQSLLDHTIMNTQDMYAPYNVGPIHQKIYDKLKKLLTEDDFSPMDDDCQ